MRTHKLKKIGKHDKYWLTFEPWFLEKIHACHPYTQSMFIHLFKGAIHQAGKKVEIVEEQFPNLVNDYNLACKDLSYERYMALRAIERGYRMLDCKTEKNLETLEWIVQKIFSE